MSLEWEPVGDDDAAQEDGCSPDEETREDQIARQVPSPAQQDVDDDHGGKDEQADEHTPPKRVRPAEDRAQRLCDVLVLLGSR